MTHQEVYEFMKTMKYAMLTDAEKAKVQIAEAMLPLGKIKPKLAAEVAAILAR